MMFYIKRKYRNILLVQQTQNQSTHIPINHLHDIYMTVKRNNTIIFKIYI